MRVSIRKGTDFHSLFKKTYLEKKQTNKQTKKKLKNKTKQNRENLKITTRLERDHRD